MLSYYFLDWTNSFWSNLIKNFRSKWDVRNTKDIINNMRKKLFHKTLTRWYKAQGQAFVENGFWLSTGQGEPCPLQIQNYLEWNEVFWGKYILEIDYIISMHQHWLTIMKVGKKPPTSKTLEKLVWKKLRAFLETAKHIFKLFKISSSTDLKILQVSCDAVYFWQIGNNSFAFSLFIIWSIPFSLDCN